MSPTGARFQELLQKKGTYEIPVEERYTTFRAKIEHLNLRKRGIKSTYSFLTYVSWAIQNTNLSPEVTQLKASKVVSYDVNRFWGLNPRQVYWQSSQKRRNKIKLPWSSLHHCLEYTSY